MKIAERGVMRIRREGEVSVRFEGIEVRTEGVEKGMGCTEYLRGRLEVVKEVMKDTIDRYFSIEGKKRLSLVTIEWGDKVKLSYYGRCYWKGLRIVMCSQMRYAIEECVDMVIWHEICHLEEPNHKYRFKALESQFPNFYKIRSYYERFCYYVRAHQQELDVECLEQL